jgi:hypothetical protein
MAYRWHRGSCPSDDSPPLTSDGEASCENGYMRMGYGSVECSIVGEATINERLKLVFGIREIEGIRL